MKIARFFIKFTFFAAFTASLAIFAGAVYLDNNITKDYKIKQGDSISFDTGVPVTAVYDESDAVKAVGSEYTVNLKMFGIIPFSKANVEIVDNAHVRVLGTAFGMKLYTDGVLVVEMTDVLADGQNVNPARIGGIKKGDYIISADGKKIHTNEELSDAVANANGNEMTLVIKRDDKKFKAKVTPVLASDSETYRIGVWVRDSSAGIGTLTFYSPASNVVCGLGHGICDEDTKELIEIDSGEIVTADIVSVQKGTSGTTGQLNGVLNNDKIGDIVFNGENGVYSESKTDFSEAELMEIALKPEISDGEAQILCSIDENEPKYYNCKIKVRKQAYFSASQNMLVEVTDEELLSATGGIVQGL